MRRKPRPPAPDPRAPWQIEQAERCGCKGTDDMCLCQNVNAAEWRSPPTPLMRSPARDYHQVAYAFPTQSAARAFRDAVARIRFIPQAEIGPSARQGSEANTSAGTEAHDEH